MNLGHTLVIAAHPDDEALGAGGTISRLRREGSRVRVMFLADGETSRENLSMVEAQGRVEKRHACAMAAARLSGFEVAGFLDLPDNRLDSIDLLDVVQPIEKEIRDFAPRTVLTHAPTDLNVDHKIAAKATLTATRPLESSSVMNVLYFETLSSTEWSFGSAGRQFEPNFYVDVTNDLDLKVQLLSCYESELRRAPHPRSPEVVRAMATRRGSEAGFVAAEAFQVARLRLGNA